MCYLERCVQCSLQTIIYRLLLLLVSDSFERSELLALHNTCNPLCRPQLIYARQ